MTKGGAAACTGAATGDHRGSPVGGSLIPAASDYARRMKTTRVRSIVIAALLTTSLAACGGTGPPGSSAGSKPAATQKPGAGTIDCAKLTEAATQLFALQLLAQMTTPENIESIKSVGNLDLDKMLSAFADLHALDGVSSALGDAKASIDFYEKAAKAAKSLLAMDPVTQVAIDAYNKDNVGSVADFLGKQLAISGAMDAAGC